jgi:hypothetical protein
MNKAVAELSGNSTVLKTVELLSGERVYVGGAQVVGQSTGHQEQVSLDEYHTVELGTESTIVMGTPASHKYLVNSRSDSMIIGGQGFDVMEFASEPTFTEITENGALTRLTAEVRGAPVTSDLAGVESIEWTTPEGGKGYRHLGGDTTIQTPLGPISAIAPTEQGVRSWGGLGDNPGDLRFSPGSMSPATLIRMAILTSCMPTPLLGQVFNLPWCFWRTGAIDMSSIS